MTAKMHRSESRVVIRIASSAASQLQLPSLGPENQWKIVVARLPPSAPCQSKQAFQ